jgi:signal transduction histidine kinase
LETVRRSRADATGRIAEPRTPSLVNGDHSDVEGSIRRALDAAIAVTRSPVGFVGLVDESGETQVVSKRADPGADISNDAMRQLARRIIEGDAPTTPSPTFIGAQLRASDALLGVLVVASAPAYTAADREAVAFIAESMAAGIELGRVRRSRQALVETLVNVRAELEASDRRRLLSEERARSAERLERAQTLAIDALSGISAGLRAGESLDGFYRRLTSSVAELVGASKVLFWQLQPNRTLKAIPGAYGIDDDFIAGLFPAPCEPEGTDLTSQVVYNDMIFRAALGDREQSQRDRRVLDTLQVTNAISVPWRAGDERLGVVAAYDSRLPGGFTHEDAWVLQIIGLVAGLVWQLKHAEAQLGKTVDRLQKVDSARQLLLRNLSTAVDLAQKRFATQLHDDALQKLTAAELHLERASRPAMGAPDSTALDETRSLLHDVEEALRKLLFDVRPPALESPKGLEETIRDRVELLEAHADIAVEMELSLGDEPGYELKALIYRQIAEALTNIEKHAAASRVRLEMRMEDDGIYCAITDDGTGFVVSDRNHLPGHLGLLALNERALLAGGWCKISSEPGAGTIVEFWVPLPK